MRSKLKALRKLAGLTQNDMAKKLGYKYTSGYNQLETGKRSINIDTAKSIADILKRPLEEIFFDSEVVKTTTNTNDDHNSLVRNVI